MERLCDLLFELSNTDRVMILNHLKTKPDNITRISKELEITTQETSRHITRMTEVGLLKRLPDGTYEISSYGKIVLNQISGIEFSSSQREYFKEHSLEQLPYEFISRIGELKETQYIDNVMAVFQKIQEVCDEAEEYIYRITDMRLNIIYPNIQDAADRGVEYLRIEPEELSESPVISSLPPVDPGRVRGIKSVGIFMALTEKEVGGLAFPRLSGEFDYLGFTSKDPKALKWCKDLFQYYWSRGKEKQFNV